MMLFRLYLARCGQRFPAFPEGVVGVGDNDKRSWVVLPDNMFYAGYLLVAHHEEKHLFLLSRIETAAFDAGGCPVELL